jgi:hypothetical protein
VTAIEAGLPAVLVSRKLAGVVTPVALADTVYWAPTVVFAVKTAEVATPEAFVVAVLTPPAKVPLGPVVGAVNVTTVPAPTGFPPESLTVTTNGANAVPLATL